MGLPNLSLCRLSNEDLPMIDYKKVHADKVQMLNKFMTAKKKAEKNGTITYKKIN